MNPPAPWWRRLSGLDWLAIGLLSAGGIAIAVWLLPWTEAEATGKRIVPLLVFLGAVILLAELAAGPRSSMSSPPG